MLDIERRLVRNIDWVLVLTTLALVAFGLVAIYSATSALVPSDPFHYVKRQALGGALGTGLALISLLFDYRVWARYVRIIYLGIVALLAALPFLAPTIMGAGRWLVLGPVQIQPSELAKIAVIITLAHHLASKAEVDHPLDLASPLVHVGVPMALIMLQPDLGTALVFVGILFGMLYVRGFPTKYLVAVGAAGLTVFVAAAVLSLYGWLPLLKEYQVRRLLIFLNPYSDRTGSGWNVIQSMIAIGSGGFFGKGLFSGSQTQLNFLPARHTDFIFSVIAEELGFLGAISLLSLYGIFLWRCVRLVALAKDRFGALLVTGLASMILFHVLINVGMTLGVMPVTGLPLPFVSAGGTSLMTNLVAVGIALNVHMRRHKILF